MVIGLSRSFHGQLEPGVAKRHSETP
jgi:hypothetical protein